MVSTSWPEWATPTWSVSGVKFTTPPAFFFKFPPAPLPAVLPPPPRDPSLGHPFPIPTGIYNAALSASVPITFAIVYATTITYLNSVNKRRGNKPWAISQTNLFTLFVLLHNAFLALYSAWTFVGMFHAAKATLENPFRNPYGLAATIDSLCKPHGPRGIGSAAVYDPVKLQYSIPNPAYHLAKDTFLPEATDVGRIWNEGLAFYGWIFYLSKFYEVVDTLIIIAKGKKSSFLQTYHHAGAMMCMWAGIRYMSPAIWLFVFLNSFIHTIMYFFYFCTALKIKVPKPLRQTLTTMQITQFMTGMPYAFLHFFVAYQIPVSVPYIYHFGEKIASGVSALGADATSEFSSALAAATATAGSQPWLKKLALRAAGREGLAENVQNELGEVFGLDAVHAVTDFVKREETRYRSETRWTNCLDTSGQSFAVYLNLFYLLPLTVLFMRFFIKSYSRRVEARKRHSFGESAKAVSQSLTDAGRGLGRRVSQALEDSQGWNGELSGDENGVIVDRDEIRREFAEWTEKGNENVSEGLQELRNAVKRGMGKGDETAVEHDGVDDDAQLRGTSGDVTSRQASHTASGSEKRSAENFVSEDTRSTVTDSVSYVTDRTSELAAEAVHKMESFGQTVQSSVEQVTSSVQSTFASVTETSFSDVREEIARAMTDRLRGTQETAENVVESATEKAGEIKEAVVEKADATAGAQNLTASDVKDVLKNIQDTTVETAQETTAAVSSQAQKVAEKLETSTADIRQTLNESSTSTQKKVGEMRDGATDRAQESKSESEREAPSGATTITTKVEVEELPTSISKAEQDKVIDESQLVRDEEVTSKGSTTKESKKETKSTSMTQSTTNALAESKHEDLTESFVKDDLSYAEAVKESSPSDETDAIKSEDASETKAKPERSAVAAGSSNEDTAAAESTVKTENQQGEASELAKKDEDLDKADKDKEDLHNMTSSHAPASTIVPGSTNRSVETVVDRNADAADEQDDSDPGFDKRVINARTSLLSAINSRIGTGSRTTSDPALTSTVIHSSPARSLHSSFSGSSASELDFGGTPFSPDQSFHSAQAPSTGRHPSGLYRSSTTTGIPTLNEESASSTSDFWSGGRSSITRGTTISDQSRTSLSSSSVRTTSSSAGSSSALTQRSTANSADPTIVSSAEFFHPRRRYTPPSPSPVPRQGSGSATMTTIASSAAKPSSLDPANIDVISDSSSEYDDERDYENITSVESSPATISTSRSSHPEQDLAVNTKGTATRPDGTETPTTPSASTPDLNSSVYFSFGNIAKASIPSGEDDDQSGQNANVNVNANIREDQEKRETK